MITFDTGVLIALERRDRVMWNRFRRLRERHIRVVIPSSCVSEWWRRGRDQAELRLAIRPLVVPLTEAIACAAGEALGAFRRTRRVDATTTIDAHVMATAALFGSGAVITSDPDDLSMFERHFPQLTIEAL